MSSTKKALSLSLSLLLLDTAGTEVEGLSYQQREERGETMHVFQTLSPFLGEHQWLQRRPAAPWTMHPQPLWSHDNYGDHTIPATV